MSLPVRLMRLNLLPFALLGKSDKSQSGPQLPNGVVRLHHVVSVDRRLLDQPTRCTQQGGIAVSGLAHHLTSLYVLRRTI